LISHTFVFTNTLWTKSEAQPGLLSAQQYIVTSATAHSSGKWKPYIRSIQILYGMFTVLNVVPYLVPYQMTAVFSSSQTQTAYTAALLLFQAYLLNSSKIHPQMATVIWKKFHV
jgi:hypothetical protein